jgi:ribosomal-protein-serine acetyltransferase
MLSLTPSNDIELRILELKDAKTVFQTIDKNRIRLKQWLGWLDFTNSVEDIKKFIQDGLDGYGENKIFRFGIYYKNQYAGNIELQSIDYTNKKSIIGYWLADGYEGKGIMTQSVEAVLKYAFEELKLNKISLQIATENIGSNKIAERIGFTREGILRQNEWLYDHFVDHYIYSLLITEWNKL